VLGPPDGVIIGKGPKLEALIGEEFLHELLESGIEIGAGAAGVGEEEPALLDVVAEVLLGQDIELGDLVSVEEDDGRLEEVGDGGESGIDDLPGEEVFPVARDDGDEVADVVGVVVPVSPGPVAELVDQDRRAALGQKQKREAGGDRPVSLDQRALPEARKLILLVNQLFGPQAIPVVLAEETQAAQPAGPFEAIKIVELPLLAVPVVLTDLEVVGQPVDPALEAGIGPPLAAVIDQLSMEGLLALEAFQTGDDQAGNPRAGHAGRRSRRIGRVGPTPINLLATFPVGSRQGPDLGPDGHSNLAGRAQAEQGVLTVGVVTGLAALGAGVGPGTGPGNPV